MDKPCHSGSPFFLLTGFLVGPALRSRTRTVWNRNSFPQFPLRQSVEEDKVRKGRISRFTTCEKFLARHMLLMASVSQCTKGKLPRFSVTMVRMVLNAYRCVPIPSRCRSNTICLYCCAGAGKSTIINMLTGTIAPSDGYARIAGRDIRTQMPQIRTDLGICPQHNCLFAQLTVREHIQFFSRLKGLYGQMSWREAEDHVDQVLQDIALSEKRNTLSRNLSGGMKRKLSVAIAFCGGSTFVLLDEPTSGMVCCILLVQFLFMLVFQFTDQNYIIRTHFPVD